MMNMALFGNNLAGPYDDSTLVRYLLGDLPTEVAERIEERYFCDKRFFEHVGAIESDLIRSANKLSARDRILFEKKYLTVPALRAKVESVRHSQVVENQPPHVERSASIWRFLRKPSYAVPAFAGVLFIATVAYWSTHEKPSSTATARVESGTGAGEKMPVGSIVAMTLPPGLLKGGQSQAHVIKLTPNTGRVEITLLLSGSHPAATHADAELLRVEATRRVSVLIVNDIPVDLLGSDSAVRLSLYATRLSPGDYLCYLRPGNSGAEANPIGTYAFSVDRE